MYEEKRLRYLERVKRENVSKGSNRKVQEQGVEGTTSSTASLISASEHQEEICAPENRASSEENRRRLEMDHCLSIAGNNRSGLVGRMIDAQDNGDGDGNRYNGRNQLEEQVHKTPFRSKSKQATKQHRTACDNVEYTGRLREKMTEDSVATLPSFIKDVHKPTRGSLPILPPPDTMEDRIGSERGSTGVAYAAGDTDGKAIRNRKAKYAQQLREQIVANEKARRAVDSEKKESSAAASAIPGTSGEGDVADRTVRAREEYAQQLREQIASKIADNHAERQKDYVDPTASDGLAWLESATEGRERQRRILKAKYAEQLRAQIAERAGGQRRLKVDSHAPHEKMSGGLSLSRNRGERASDAVAHRDDEVRPSHTPSDESPAFER